MADAEENLDIVTVLLEENEELKQKMENVRKECDKRIEVRTYLVRIATSDKLISILEINKKKSRGSRV